MTYTINSILNNSALTAVDSKGSEYVLIGRGISFGKTAGESVDETKIERKFGHSNEEVKQNQHLLELIEDIPEEYFEIANVIIRYATKKLNIQMNSSAYINIADHINNAIERYYDGIQLSFSLLDEVKSFYPKEYKVAEWIVDFLNAQIDIDLSEDEIGFIAMHLINAGGGDFQQVSQVKKVLELTRLISKQVLELLPDTDVGSLDYSRFLTHLKYFGIRYFGKEQSKRDDVEILLKTEKSAEIDDIINNIEHLLVEYYNKPLDQHEKLYLKLHLNRIIY
ncbi:PRD domain-containing protein [Streptococcus lutetiensis]|uniref:PRD domain-containing protein n=1 Tax=Streptococcus lutetiensis TaxID=150055 RepID=UPI001BD9ED45|nr:PRD domain-containing protein [Streptococcus lutetiensis]MBT0930270.1 PRD domain-containing protein [Streptococcus lutetiensis]